MAPGIKKLVFRELKGIREANATIERLAEAASPAGAYAEPVQVGEYTIITATETSCLLGVGYGVGAGQPELDQDEPVAEAAEGYGGGGGGGGFATARPVAAIIIGPQGVTVQPIRDVTKVLLALATALGSMALTLGRMRRQRDV